MMNSKTKKKKGYEKIFEELIGKLKECERCKFEFVEAFLHSKNNPSDKVCLSVSYDDEVHVGIRVYDKNGEWVMG